MITVAINVYIVLGVCLEVSTNILLTSNVLVWVYNMLCICVSSQHSFVEILTPLQGGGILRASRDL